jgi:PAS domain S-box-containing protein
MEISHEQLCRQLVDTCNDAIMFSDRDGIIQLWNAGATALFGYTATEALGQSLDLIIPENLRARHWEGYHKVMASGVTRYATELLAAPALCKDGSRISTEFSMILVRSKTGAVLGTGAVIRNVTARWQKEKALKERLAELEKR